MSWHRWRRRSLVALMYLVVWYIATVGAFALGDAVGVLVFALGVAGPILYWEWRLFQRLYRRDPEHIIKALRRGRRVELRLPSGMSAAWDPAQGLYGQVSGPGVVTYSLVNDSTVRFTYRGHWGDRDVTTAVPAVLVPGTPEAVRAASVDRQLVVALLSFLGAPPAIFAIGYFVSAGTRAQRAAQAGVAVLWVLVIVVVGSRVLSLGLAARKRREGAEHDQSQ